MFVFSRWWTYLRNITRRFTLIIAYFLVMKSRSRKITSGISFSGENDAGSRTHYLVLRKSCFRNLKVSVVIKILGTFPWHLIGVFMFLVVKVFFAQFCFILVHFVFKIAINEKKKLITTILIVWKNEFRLVQHSKNLLTFCRHFILWHIGCFLTIYFPKFRQRIL